jgi:hypothetical protein
MNRKLLSEAAPRWIAIQTLPAQVRFDLIAVFMDAILDAIEIDHGEPDTWEAVYAAYTIHALVEGRYYAALTFAEMALIEPDLHRPPRLLPDGPEAVTLEQLRVAMAAVRSRPAADPR